MSRKTALSPLSAVSLFSNCGAGDVGFARAGFSFDVLAELVPRRLAVAQLNHPEADGVPGDLRETLPEVVLKYRRRRGDTPPDLLVACPPCQGMSSAQSARGLAADPDAGSRDARNLLVEVVANAVDELSPRALVVENVQAFLTRKVRHPRTGQPVSGATFLINELTASYEVYPLLTDLADFGVPQSRKRSFLTFIRRSETAISVLQRHGWAPYPWAPRSTGADTQHISVRDALNSFDLPPLDAGSAERAASGMPMHSVPIWPDLRYRMISSIPPNTGMSAWDNDTCTECGWRTEDRAAARCEACGAILPRPVTKDDDGTMRLVRGFHTSYRRMHSDKPASTVTTASGHVGSDITIHPWENRVLSPLECQLLQTIPSSFRWGDALETWGPTNVRAMIGEAVPPLFTRKHGRILAQLLRGIAPRVALPAEDRRIGAARRALQRSSRMSASVCRL